MGNSFRYISGGINSSLLVVLVILVLAVVFLAVIGRNPVVAPYKPVPEVAAPASVSKENIDITNTYDSEATVEKSADTGVKVNVDYDTVRQLLITQPAARQLQLLRDGDTFVAFVQQEIRHQSLVAMALEQGVQSSPRADFLTSRAVAEVLRNLYNDQYLRSRIDNDWPSEEQMRTAYDENPDQYVLPRRVHLWQIFIPAPEGVSEEVLQQQQDAAQKIFIDLNDGSISFVDAAARFSRHGQSRNRGGYMGLVDLQGLRPQFREAVEALAEDVVSAPVRDEDGFHILRRGGYRETYPLSFAEAKPVLRTSMRRQLAQRLQQELVDEALRKNPYEIPGSDVRTWWNQLRQEALSQARAKAGEEISEGETVVGNDDGDAAGTMKNRDAADGAASGDGI